MKTFGMKPGKPAVGFAMEKSGEATIRNSTGSNTHVPPKEPEVRTAVFTEGIENRWLEYVPTTYKPGNKVPLVIACHGGGVNDQVQFDETSWIYVAESEGLIAVFPNASANRAWLLAGMERPKMGPGGGPVMPLNEDGVVDEENPDIRFIKGLIKNVASRYDIDEGRVYMQGMSMGDLMTMQFSRVCGDLLAGADNTAGPTTEDALFTQDGKLKYAKCPVPIYQCRGELDDGAHKPVWAGDDYTRQDINAANRRFWKLVNGITAPPRLSIRGEVNLAFYDGEKAPMVYRDVKYRDHGQTFDDAMWAWHTLFSGTRRNPDGSLSFTEPLEARKGDKHAAALAVGIPKAYVNNKLVELDGAPYFGHVMHMDHVKRQPIELLDVFYVPVTFLPVYFGGSVELGEDGRTARITTAEGENWDVSEGNVAVVHNKRLYSMLCQCEVKDGCVYVPLKWMATQVYGKFVTECDGAIYVSERFGEMTKDMSRIIREEVLS